MQRIHALIPAAGRSVRFGGTTLKQYAHLLGKPVLGHSIDAVRCSKAVLSVTVALAEDDGIFEALMRPAYPSVHTTIGGVSRAQTVINGVYHILERDPSCEWVLVHDAARPCLSQEALTRLLRQGLQCPDGAILAVPVHDTLKVADASSRIAKTADRTRYWAAQTPQLFPARELAASLEAALDAGESPTDEAAAMERVGARPLLVEDRRTNIKITGPEDLALAQFILERQSGDE
jgi:2-C-methyl-D-erythritol 4-phosphate cytidylyltransferase